MGLDFIVKKDAGAASQATERGTCVYPIIKGKEIKTWVVDNDSDDSNWDNAKGYHYNNSGSHFRAIFMFFLNYVAINIII